MTVRTINKKAVSTAQNGVGAFILQCKRLEFHYCDWAGSSKGMNSFLSHHLPAFASRSPSVAMHVSPRPRKHPVIRAHYINGASRAVCVRNLSPEQVVQKAELLRNAGGVENRKIRGGRFVSSLNESVRGVWSSLHAGTTAQAADVWSWPGKAGKRKKDVEV